MFFRPDPPGVQSITTDALEIASSIVNSGSKPIALKASTLFSRTESLAPFLIKLSIFGLSIESAECLWNVTSSIPKLLYCSHNIPISGSPIVPVPTTCTIFLSMLFISSKNN